MIEPDKRRPDSVIVSWVHYGLSTFSIHMEQNLINDDLIRQLCASHDLHLAQQHRADNNCHLFSGRDSLLRRRRQRLDHSVVVIAL